MGVHVSNIIGICTGGVFSPATDTRDIQNRIIKIIKEMDEWDFPTDLGEHGEYL